MTINSVGQAETAGAALGGLVGGGLGIAAGGGAAALLGNFTGTQLGAVIGIGLYENPSMGFNTNPALGGGMVFGMPFGRSDYVLDRDDICSVLDDRDCFEAEPEGSAVMASLTSLVVTQTTTTTVAFNHVELHAHSVIDLLNPYDYYYSAPHPAIVGESWSSGPWIS